MHDQTVQVDDLRLVALPSAVNCAELFVRFTLTEWRVLSMLDDATDTVTRLTRAVIAGVDKTAPLTMITIRLRLSGGFLNVEIVDDRPYPTLRVPEELTGKGSGATTLDDGRQLMWRELPLPTGMDARVVPLPRRGTTKTTTVQPAKDDPDADLGPDVMERILDGLRKDRPDL